MPDSSPPKPWRALLFLEAENSGPVSGTPPRAVEVRLTARIPVAPPSFGDRRRASGCRVFADADLPRIGRAEAAVCRTRRSMAWPAGPHANRAGGRRTGSSSASRRPRGHWRNAPRFRRRRRVLFPAPPCAASSTAQARPTARGSARRKCRGAAPRRRRRGPGFPCCGRRRARCRRYILGRPSPPQAQPRNGVAAIHQR